MTPLPLRRSVSEQPESRPNVLNADNADYQPLVGRDGHVYGDLDELNGDGARETSFRPTRHELIQLVKYWARESLHVGYFSFTTGMAPSELGEAQLWLASFGDRRVERAVGLLGDDVVQRAIAEAHNDFRKGRMTLRQFDIFMNGTRAERLQVHDELDDGWTTMTAMKEAEKLQEEERDRWAERHQATRDAARDLRRRRRALEEEVQRLREQIETLE